MTANGARKNEGELQVTIGQQTKISLGLLIALLTIVAGLLGLGINQFRRVESTFQRVELLSLQVDRMEANNDLRLRRLESKVDDLSERLIRLEARYDVDKADAYGPVQRNNR